MLAGGDEVGEEKILQMFELSIQHEYHRSSTSELDIMCAGMTQLEGAER